METLTPDELAALETLTPNERRELFIAYTKERSPRAFALAVAIAKASGLLFDDISQPLQADRLRFALFALEELDKFDGTNKSAEALQVAFDYGGIDGAHHKTWVIDQMVRALTGDHYDEWVAEHNDGEEGPDTYDWDEGVAP